MAVPLRPPAAFSGKPELYLRLEPVHPAADSANHAGAAGRTIGRNTRTAPPRRTVARTVRSTARYPPDLAATRHRQLLGQPYRRRTRRLAAAETAACMDSRQRPAVYRSRFQHPFFRRPPSDIGRGQPFLRICRRTGHLSRLGIAKRPQLPPDRYHPRWAVPL